MAVKTLKAVQQFEDFLGAVVFYKWFIDGLLVEGEY